MLKPTGLVAGHYECRSLEQTLPVLIDLLAMEVIERRPGEAVAKHPNTDWKLIVHEGGPGAPEKTFDNHYGFRVASHQEVEAAWKFLEANKENYGLSKITKPQSSHFAYSIYFCEPGGNHLEIEYYNPGGALHGRSHTAGHWQSELTSAQFPGRGYVPQAFTHGTLQCDDLERTRSFLIGVLGLEQAGGFNDRTVYVKHPATPWYIVMLPRRPRQYLAPVNRFTLELASAAEVEKAYHDFTEKRLELGLTELRELEKSNERANYIFCDFDKNWWEITSSD